jgi:hypothetical protein
MESLEGRVLLYGDHPGLVLPITPGTVATPVPAFDADGNASINGIIQPPGTTGPGGIVPVSGDNDLFTFVAPSNDFVRVLAATINNSGAASGLDSRVRVYNTAGQVLTTSGQFADPSTPGISLAGDNNGILSTTRPNPAPDGWAGFVATAGQRYYVQVLGQNGTQGTYTLRVGTATTVLAINALTGEGAVPPEIAPPPVVPYTPPIPQLLFPQHELFWRVTTPNNPIFDSVATVTGAAFRAPHAGLPPIPAAGPVDVHLEVYDQAGKLIASDIEAGFLNDAFVAFKAAPNQTYFIRARGDDLRNPAQFTSTGPFQVRVDFSAQDLDIPVNPITRRGEATGGLADAAATMLYRFTSQGTGLTFITVKALPPPNHDVSVRLFDAAGNFVAFNDDFTPLGGTDAQIQAQLVGGKVYFVVVDGFDDAPSGAFGLWVESHHTFNTSQPVDDHIDRPTSASTLVNLRALEYATPLQFGAPQLLVDGNGNPVRDRSYFTQAFGSGRIHETGDSDMFMFTPQLDMLGDYDGDNDDAGLALYVGGAFLAADPNAANFVPVNSRALAAWDAADFWFTGPQGPTGSPAPLDRYGFGDGNPATDNPDIPNLPGTTTDQGGVIYTMQVWQPPGFARPLLWVGGDFALTVPGPFGPTQIFNLAAWGFDPFSGQYTWFDVGGANAPVRAMAVYDPVSFDPDGSDTGPGTGGLQSLPAVLDPRAEAIYFGGDFTQIGGINANRVAGFNLISGFFPLAGGITNGSVRALAVYDPVDPGDDRAYQSANPAIGRVRDIPDPPVSLFIGGTFTNVAGLNQSHLVRWDGVKFNRPSFAPVRGTQPGIVANPEPIVTFNPVPGQPVAVNALRVYTQPQTQGGPQQEPKLIIAGSFQSVTIATLDYSPPGEQPAPTPPNPAPLPNVRAAQTIVSPNIIQFGRKADPQRGDDAADQALNVYQPRLLYEAVVDLDANGQPAGTPGTNGPVRAMTVWDPPDVFGQDSLPPMLVIGGTFTSTGDINNVGNLGAWNGAWGAFGFGTGANGPVFALTNLAGDVQEPGIPRIDALFPPANDPQEVLYIGGAFSALAGTPVANVAQIAFDPNVPGFAVQALNTGVDAPVFALTPFDDQNPQFDNSGSQWDRHDRPSTRLQIVANPTADSFLDIGLRVFDSNFNLVYPTNATGPYHVQPAGQPPANTTISPPFPDPAGMIDPSNAPGTPQAIVGIPLYGGEVYYIEIFAIGGIGRYEFSVRIDAVPPDLGSPGNPGVPDGVPDDVNSIIVETTDEGDFNNAENIVRDLASGDGTGYRPAVDDASGIRVFPRASRANQTPTTPSGFLIAQWSDQHAIETIDDTDLFSFIAEDNGTVQVRIVTTGIGVDPTNPTNPQVSPGDDFFERQFDFSNVPPAAGPTVTNGPLKTKQYNSLLDAALRVFSNDFVQIGVSDYNPALAGEIAADPSGTFVRTFRHRDPVLTFKVRRGEKYYLQVESSQRALWGSADQDKIDWRYAIGGYEIIIDAPANLNFDDDFSGTLPSPIPIGTQNPILPTDPPNGGGTISGVIDNTLANPDDTDAFYMNTVARGPVTLTFTTPGASTLRAAVNVTNIDTGFVVAQGASTPGTPLSLNWIAQRGDIYVIVVDGIGSSEGAYTITVQGQPYVDDRPQHAFDLAGNPVPNGSFLGSQWLNTSALSVNRFFGTAVVNGQIEDASDLDVYTYTSETWEIATVTVTSNSPTLNPFVRVFEVGEDPLGENPPGTPVHPVYLQIGQNNDFPGLGTNSRAQFSMTPGRTYYIQVSGASPDAHFGAYTLTLAVIPTDDHPNLADRPVATQVPITYDSLSGVGTGSRNGVIERDTDNDLFVFTAPATGGFFINVATPGSLLAPRVELRNAAGGLITSGEGAFGEANIGATSGLLQGQIYYVVVYPGTPDDPQETDRFGSYVLTVTTLPVDDHPNAGEFGLIGPNDIISLNPSTGIGLGSGVIVPFTDTDLFRVTTLAAGNLVVQLATPNSAFDGRLRLFNASFVQIAINSGDSDTALVSTNATAAGQVYYILVEPDVTASGPTLTGSYSLRVTGAIGGGGGGGPGPDDHPNAGDFANASPLALDPRTGEGSRGGIINFLGDTDLFTFTVPSYANGRAGSVFLQVVTPVGGVLDAAVRVFDANFNQVRFDALGIPGATAATSFTSTGGVYYALVEQVGSNTGAYTLRVAADPGVSRMYYPEGFAGSTINEFVPLVNANPFTVRILQVIAHYEFDPNDPNAPRDQVLTLAPEEMVLAPNSRGGFTVSTAADQANAKVRIGRPYALQIISDGPLGGSFSHYDFGVTVGESFTNRTSTIWTFAEARRDATKYADFLVYFNPNDTDAHVTVTLTYDDGSVTTFTRTVPAWRRDGVGFNTDGSVTRNGVFAVKVESDIGIVAALSSYDFVNGRGDGWLGNPDGGATEGAVPGVSSGSGVDSSIAIYNANASPATVTIHVSYARVDLPDLVKVVTVAGQSRTSMTLASLGLVPGQVAGLRYSSNQAVTVNVLEYRFGDGDGAVTPTTAATTAVIGDAFVNPAAAGVLYIEELGLFNPASLAVNVTITFLFVDGSAAAQSVTIAPNQFAFIRIDQQPAILNRVEPTAFSLRLDATTPFVATFAHYDLFLNGGWRAVPQPIGLVNPLDTI